MDIYIRILQIFLKDLEKADRVLKDILGEEFDSKIMRFPGGSFGKHKAPMKKSCNRCRIPIY